MEPETILPKYTIRDLKILRIIADPLHTQIYEALVDGPLTIKQVAARLGQAPSKLYYHFDLMETHGLIRVVETRTVSNMIEKLYRAIAREIDVDNSLLSFSSDENKEAVQEIIASTVDVAREDLMRSIQARLAEREKDPEQKQLKVLLNRSLVKLTETQAESFYSRLEELVKEFMAIDQTSPEDPSEERRAYSLLVALHPSFYYPEEQN